MTTHSTSKVRRYAAVGTTVAMLVGSAAMGIGATAASAAETGDAATAEQAPIATSTPTPTPTGTPTPEATSTPTSTPPTETAPPPPAAPATPAAPAAPAESATPRPLAAAAPEASADAATPAETVTITGTPRAWQTLTADTAGWPEGTTFTYEWHFHHPVLSDRNPGTDRTYIVDPEQRDGTLDVTVTGTAPGMAPTTVTSAPSAPVVTLPDDLQFTYGDRTVRVTVGEPFSIPLSPASNPDLEFFANGQIQGMPDPSVLPAGVTLSRDGVLSGTLSSTFVPGDIWIHVSTPRHPNGGLSERLILVVEPDPNGTPLQFGEGATEDAPLELESTAGEPFAHTFTATGGTEPVRYELVQSDAVPLPDGYALDPATGVLRGTSTDVNHFSFQVVATSGDERAVTFVGLHVGPAAAAALRVFADLAGDAEQRSWTIEPDGSVSALWYPNGAQRDPERSTGDGPTVRQGGALLLKAAPVDRFGNYTSALEVPAEDWVFPTVTSDIGSDRVSTNGLSVQVAFPHASTHTLTVRSAGVSTSFAVTVLPVASASGGLAYTGADTTAPLTWALGLLGAGAALLVHRVHRRRA